MLTTAIQYPAGRSGCPSPQSLRRWLAPCPWSGFVVLRFVDQAEAIALNHQFRGHHQPTNVLSFDYRDQPRCLSWRDKAELEGDIALYMPLIREQAEAVDLAVDAHCAHLVIHGVLHLAGHDHMNESDTQRMEQLEQAWLSQLGFGLEVLAQMF